MQCALYPIKPIGMKIAFATLLIAVALASCTKDNVKPGGDSTSKTSTNGNSSTGDNSKTSTSGGSILTHDDSVHMAVFRIAPQQVKTSVSGADLTLKFEENVDLFFLADAYQKISAVHLFEDFTKSSLNGVDYTTVAEGGNTTFDWVDDNLNNVVLKTVSDTTIANVAVVKINVHREFTFLKTYKSNLAAVTEQNYLLNKKSDVIGFSSYTYYNENNYPYVSAAVAVAYTK